MLNTLPPLGLYIHLPWCVKKCPYCDFNSHVIKSDSNESLYLEALRADLEQALPLIWGRSIRTIFIGGGTPSLFSGDAINSIITHIRQVTNLSPMAEITIEANPGTIDNQHILDYSKSGINRISLGIQSFNDKHLATLGRVHDSSTARAAIKIAQKYFKYINLDLMYGLPNQTMDELLQDIQLAGGFNTVHLSYYNLTLEPNTAFYNQPPSGMPDNDLCYTMQELIIQQLAAFNLKRYEISAYASANNYCQHNLNYWQFGDYLGIGAGAHSKLSFHDKIIRQIRQKNPQKYMEQVQQSLHINEDKQINTTELPIEFMLNALRLTDGIPTNIFVERTGLSLTSILKQLNMAQEKKLIKLIDNKIIPTKLGLDFNNDLLLMFYN